LSFRFFLFFAAPCLGKKISTLILISQKIYVKRASWCCCCWC